MAVENNSELPVTARYTYFKKVRITFAAILKNYNQF